MSDQNVKLKSSQVAPPIQDGGKDSYKKANNNSKLSTTAGIGSSTFSSSDPQLDQWKMTQNGGMIIPGVEYDGLMETLAPMCEEIDQATEAQSSALRRGPITPQTKFDLLRQQFEYLDPVKFYGDLKDNVPDIRDIPTNAELSSNVSDPTLRQNFYKEKRKIIKLEIKHTKTILNTQGDVRIVQARQKYLEFLEQQLKFVESEMTKTV